MNYNIALHSIKEIEFFIKELSSSNIKTFDENDLNVSFGYNFSILPEDFLEITIVVKYEHNNSVKTQMDKILEIKCMFIFDIENISSLVKVAKDKSIEIPNDLMVNLLGISISSLRGIIHSRTQNYFIQDYPLPLFNANDLINS